jgi:DNA polymerase III delta subunit
LVSEIEKLRYRQTAHPNEPLSAKVVEEVVFSRVEANSFKFFDYLFSSPQQACALLDKMQNEGTNWNEASGVLFRGLRNYLLTLDLYEHGVRESKVLMSEGKLAPFVASNLLRQIETLQEHTAFIKHFFKKLVELDYEIKQGIVPAEYFRLNVKELIFS